jgi:ethanolamine utilization protein EutQ
MPAASTRSGATSFTPHDVKAWTQSGERGVFLGDVLDESNSEALGVGFARYAPGASNEWLVTYDEVLIITSGIFSVTTANGRQTAKAGELIFLNRDTKLVYSAGDEGAELVYVMYPHWTHTAVYTDPQHADLATSFHPIDAVPPRFADGLAQGNLAILKRIWDPLESGESTDYQPWYDLMAEDIVLETSAMTLRGRDAVIGYFDHGSRLMDYDIFVRPFRYFAAGNQVVQHGFETFRVKDTGVTHSAEWAWIYDFRDGKISRILGIEDLSPIADVEAKAAARAQAEADARAAVDVPA